MGVAVLLMYMLMMMLFGSLMLPLAVLMSLPLALVGALGAMALTHSAFTLFSMLGVAVLLGLVGKNAILLVDRTDHLRASGMDRSAALLAAGPSRLRPIVMTTVSVMAALLPIVSGRRGRLRAAAERGAGADRRAADLDAADAGVRAGDVHRVRRPPGWHRPPLALASFGTKLARGAADRHDILSSGHRHCDRPRSIECRSTAMLHDSLDQWAARQPEALWAAEASRRITFGEAQSATHRLAASIQHAGVAPGERVAVLARNRLEFVLLYYAASRAGVTLVPLNTRLAAEEWAFILADAAPRIVFVDPSFVASLPDTPATTVVFDADFSAWLEHGEELVDVSADEDRDLLQLYTSATTGRPKGAVLTQRAVCANIAQVGEAIQTPPGERSLVVAPLFHAGVVPSTLTPLARGGSVYLQAEFRPAEVVDALEREGIGYTVLVPAMLQACLRDSSLSRPPGALRLVYYGSSPIAESTLRAAIAAFNCEFIQSYGMTEATQSVSFLTHADHLRGLDDRPDLLLSAGRAVARTELRVVDAEDRPLPAGHSGEVVVRGPQVMRGYWNRAGSHRRHLAQWLAAHR